MTVFAFDIIFLIVSVLLFAISSSNDPWSPIVIPFAVLTPYTFDFLELTNECLRKTDLYFTQIEFIPVLKQYQRTYENRGRVSRSKIFNSTKRIIEDLSNESELLKKINDWFKDSSVKSTFEVIETGDYKKLIVS